MRSYLLLLASGSVRRQVDSVADLNLAEEEWPEWLDDLIAKHTAPKEEYPAYVGTADYHNSEKNMTLTATVHYPARAKAPLYVRFPGTDEPPSPTIISWPGAEPKPVGMLVSVADHSELAGMAARGYVSAMVAYPADSACFFCAVTEPPTCTPQEAQANCLKDQTLRATDAKNALDVLCADERVDCSLGVAVSGFSQGSQVAMLLSVVDDRPTAVLGISPVGIFMDGKSMKVPKNKRRFVTGEKDSIASQIAGGVAPGWWLQLDPPVAEVTCAAEELSCLQEDGSGYVVLPGEGHDMFADMGELDANSGSITAATTIRKDWVVGQGKASYDWLAKAART